MNVLMSISFDLNAHYGVAAANSHYYKIPTEERYIDRILPYHDFIYLIDGQWAITEDKVEYPLEKGDVLLLAAGHHHYTRRPCQAGTRTYCIHVDKDLLHAPASSCDCVCLPTLIHAQGSACIKRYFEDIVSTYWMEDEPYKQKRLCLLAELLILELCSAQRQHVGVQNSMADRAIEIIMATPHHRFTQEEMSKLLFISPRTLNNAMNRKTGMPFHAYQIGLKLEMVAKKLELEPDLRMVEIANAFGFYDEFHMSKAFKKKYGVSPQQFRQLKLI